MIIPTLLLAISLSVDAFGIGISYGIKNIKISFIPLIIINLTSAICFCAAHMFGEILYTTLPIMTSKLISAAIIGSIAALTLVKAFQKTTRNLNNSKSINNWEALLLGLALSIDSIGAGAGLGLVEPLNILQPLSIGCFQLAFLSSGLYLGEKYLPLINDKFIYIISGIIMLSLMITKLI